MSQGSADFHIDVTQGKRLPPPPASRSGGHEREQGLITVALFISLKNSPSCSLFQMPGQRPGQLHDTAFLTG